MKQLKDKVVLITGASSGIGHATARLFAEQGAIVIAGARRQPELDQLVGSINDAGGTAVALTGDVTDEKYAQALVDLAIGKFKKLDAAFNNAGTLGDLGCITEMTADNWAHTINTNLTSGFLSAKHQIPAMRMQGKGSIIFTSSFVGYTAGMPGMAAYGASKAGLVGLAMNLAAAHGHEGIRVNALLPGGTDTEMAREFARTPTEIDFVRNLHALKRTADPVEIANAALFLASDASSFTTGQAIVVDGGVSICRT